MLILPMQKWINQIRFHWAIKIKLQITSVISILIVNETGQTVFTRSPDLPANCFIKSKQAAHCTVRDAQISRKGCYWTKCTAHCGRVQMQIGLRVSERQRKIEMVWRVCACLWATQKHFVCANEFTSVWFSLCLYHCCTKWKRNRLCIVAKAYWTIKTEAVCCTALCVADWIRETATHSSSSQDIAGNYP